MAHVTGAKLTYRFGVITSLKYADFCRSSPDGSWVSVEGNPASFIRLSDDQSLWKDWC